MKTDKKDFVSAIQASRSTLLELVLVAVLISLAVNLFAAGLYARLSHAADLIIAAFILAIALSYLWVTRFGALRGAFKYEGFLIYNTATGELIPAYGYDLSEDTAMLLKAALAEDESLKIVWTRNPLLRVWPPAIPRPVGREHVSAASENNPNKDDRKGHSLRLEKVEWNDESYSIVNKEGADILRELLEYVCLEWLSTHLSDFFNKGKFDKQKLKEYRREDIPEMLLRNRFLDLFSRPVNQRAAFLREEDSSKESSREHAGVEVVGVYLSSGAIYRQFDLTVPRGSTPGRVEGRGFKIDGSLMTLFVEPLFRGFETAIPGAFLRHYVGYKGKHTDVRVFQIDISIKYKISWRGIFVRRAWAYHRWAESFATSMEEKASADAFFGRIGWPTVEALLKCTNLRKPAQSSASGQHAPTNVSAPVPSPPPDHPDAPDR